MRAHFFVLNFLIFLFCSNKKGGETQLLTGARCSVISFFFCSGETSSFGGCCLECPKHAFSSAFRLRLGAFSIGFTWFVFCFLVFLSFFLGFSNFS